jgi:hypothetical protein
MEPSPRPTGRENLLTIILVLLLGGGFTFFLVMVSLGVFQYVIATVLGITLLGYLHYVLWGYSFSQEVAGEREEEQLREQLEADHDRETISPWRSAIPPAPGRRESGRAERENLIAGLTAAAIGIAVFCILRIIVVPGMPNPAYSGLLAALFSGLLAKTVFFLIRKDPDQS